MGKKKQTFPNFDFLLASSVELENCVSPAEATRDCFKADGRRPHVSGKSILDIFWSDDFRRNLPSLVE